MAKDTEKKVSIGQMEKLLKAIYKNEIEVVTYFAGDESIDIKVKNKLSYMEFAQFITEAVYCCVNRDLKTLDSYCKSFIVGLNVLKYYTNIRIPEDVSKYYDLVMCTPLLEDVKKCIDQNQYQEMLEAIDEKLEYEKTVMASDKRYSDLYDQMSRIETMLMAFGDAIDPDQINKALPALSNMEGLNAQQFIQAMIDSGVVGTKPKKGKANIVPIK